MVALWGGAAPGSADLCGERRDIWLTNVGSRPASILVGYFNMPTSPANAGAQIHPERLGMTRHDTAPIGQMLAGSTWIPAFAGKVGIVGEGSRLLATRCGHSWQMRPEAHEPDQSPCHSDHPAARQGACDATWKT